MNPAGQTDIPGALTSHSNARADAVTNRFPIAAAPDGWISRSVRPLACQGSEDHDRRS